MRRPDVLLVLALGAASGCASLGATHPPAALPAIAPTAVAGDVGWLADDAREGRGLGTPGLEAAGAYVADGFRAAGLEPGARSAADAPSFVERLELPVALEVARAELSLGGVALRRPRDFEPLPDSANGEAAGPLVFAGYGISAPSLGWDDYAGLDATGRIVVVLDGGPGDGVAALHGERAWPYRTRSHKLVAARRHGARAVLFVPPASARHASLPGGGEWSAAVQASDTIALALSRDAAVRLFARAGRDLVLRENAIEQLGRPSSAPLGRLRARVAVRLARTLGPAANVVALRRGRDPALASEAVVIGAHYDHLGRGAFGSATPDRRGEIHNGADDNASGTAGLLALARLFGALPAARRTLVLVAFTGEEAGLLGSQAYVADPPWPLADTVAMLNLDMIGRLRDDTVTVYGGESSPAFAPILADAAAAADLAIAYDADPFAPSDQVAFAARGIPTLLFFTGMHPQYHTPDDDAALVDAGGEARVLEAVARVARALLDAPERPPPAAPEATPQGVVARDAPPPATPGTSGRRYGPYLGTVPAFGAPADERGVRLQGVRPGSPAAAAGLEAGDVIVSFDGTSVGNLGELAALLYASEPGQRVRLGVLRDGRPLALEAVLGERR
ncbi:MAG TPA: M28 family peptidase [Myxococcota bacterium]|nr:M28 family peptidase [Myxococcota bacterium]